MTPEHKKNPTDALKVAKPKAEPKAKTYQMGYDDGYKVGFKAGGVSIRGFVTTVEEKLAENDGYKDREKWRREATIPAWWITVLMTHFNSPPKKEMRGE